MRLYREQLLTLEDISTEPASDLAAEARRPPEPTLDDLPDDLRELAREYESSRPGVRLTPLRYITIGGADGLTVAGTADLPDDGLVSLFVTRTIADADRAEVTSRVLLARAAPRDAAV
jgi:hypothetical protein